MQHAQQLETFIKHYPKNGLVPFWEIIRLAQELDPQVGLRTYDRNMVEFWFNDDSQFKVDYREQP
jgi:hypothetical protein